MVIPSAVEVRVARRAVRKDLIAGAVVAAVLVAAPFVSGEPWLIDLVAIWIWGYVRVIAPQKGRFAAEALIFSTLIAAWLACVAAGNEDSGAWFRQASAVWGMFLVWALIEFAIVRRRARSSGGGTGN